MSSTSGRPQQFPQASPGHRSGSGPSRSVLPEGLLTVILVVLIVLGIGAAVISYFSDNKTFQVLSLLGERIAIEDVEAEVGRPFGACADICTAGGACRFVVIEPGLRPRQAVSLERLNAAKSCR